jgi:hypothetical protein
MTTKEQKTIDDLLSVAKEMRASNQNFRTEIREKTEEIQKKVDKTHLPVTLEKDILRVAQESIAKALQSTLTGYDSPIIKLIKAVIEEHSIELKTIIKDSFSQVIRTEDFKQSIVNAFAHKVARSIISNNDGLFEKVANDLKQDAIFKSKMAIAVSNVVEECLQKE